MKRRFGASPEPEGVRFRLWAPSLEAVTLDLQGHAPAPMRAAGDGFFEHVADGARAGDRYRFASGDFVFADPASRGQVEDADGWSLVVAPFDGVRPARAVRPWREAIVAEVHVGTATPEGTFLGLVSRLGRFREAGYTAIELMPVADFMGRRNWGYDGVLPFAPDTAYGTPEDLATLVAAAHELGLGVLLDVVYNHFGPSGLALHRVAAPFFTERLPTPWGPAIDLDNAIVRDFFVENARQWIGEYGFDGLRLDAVHAFVTEGGDRLLDEIAAAVRQLKPDAWLVLENDLNAARWLERGEDGLPRRYTAQWNDDVHHVLHVAATGEKAGYYEDYADQVPSRMARAFAEGFVYQGEPSRHRGGTLRGERSAHLPPDAFVAFVQNHDQIGNRPFGDRIASRVGKERLAFLTFVGMLAPQVPLFFMGEESGLNVPFPFFVDFGPPLDEAVKRGRKAEFLHFFGAFGLEAEGEPPDPNAEATFRSAVLTDAHFDEADARLQRERFAGWARLRADVIWPLAGSAYRGAETTIGRDAFAVTWRFDAGAYAMALNFGERPARFPAPSVLSVATVGTVAEEDGTVTLGPWSAALWAGVP